MLPSCLYGPLGGGARDTPTFLLLVELSVRVNLSFLSSLDTLSLV